jgi:putative hydrolase of the HAD superfamily
MAVLFKKEALDLANSSKTDSLVIGDGLRPDVIGARNSNIDVIWFNPEKNENPFPEVISITKLNELIEIL